jgi:hypothetical protein
MKFQIAGHSCMLCQERRSREIKEQQESGITINTLKSSRIATVKKNIPFTYCMNCDGDLYKYIKNEATT